MVGFGEEGGEGLVLIVFVVFCFMFDYEMVSVVGLVCGWKKG